MAFALTTCIAMSQTTKSYKPYASLGTNISSAQLSYGAELGIYNDNTWVAVAASVAQTRNYVNNWTGTVKYYRKNGR